MPGRGVHWHGQVLVAHERRLPLCARVQSQRPDQRHVRGRVVRLGSRTGRLAAAARQSALLHERGQFELRQPNRVYLLEQLTRRRRRVLRLPRRPARVPHAAALAAAALAAAALAAAAAQGPDRVRRAHHRVREQPRGGAQAHDGDRVPRLLPRLPPLRPGQRQPGPARRAPVLPHGRRRDGARRAVRALVGRKPARERRGRDPQPGRRAVDQSRL